MNLFNKNKMEADVAKEKVEKNKKKFKKRG